MEVKYSNVYKRKKEEEHFDITGHFNAIRRNEKIALYEMIQYLKDVNKPLFYKYLAKIRIFGYDVKSLETQTDMYILEFISKFEFVAEDFNAYFYGFMNHKYIALMDQECTENKKVLGMAYSLNTYINNEESTELIDMVSSEEDVLEMYNGKELFNRFVLNEESKLLTFIEKKIIYMRYLGNTFMEISNELNISYKSVLTIYNSGVNKVKEEVGY